MKRILVYRIGQLGDALASVPSLWRLRQSFPEARLDLLTNKPANPDAVTTATVFNGTGLFSKLHLYPSSKNPFVTAQEMAALFLKLRREKYDALAYLAPSERITWQISRDKVFFRAVGIKTFWGTRVILEPSTSLRPLLHKKRESELLVARLISLNPEFSNSPLRYDLGITETEYVKMESSHVVSLKSRAKHLIAVCPFSRMPAKRWPLERYVTVLQELFRDHDCWPILVGGKEDKQEADTIIQRLGLGTNLAGSLSARETATLMRYCRLYLGNDTGAMHLAASAGIPCVALFSARTSPGAWYPAGENNRILRLSVECEGCELYQCDEKRMRCMTEIDEEDVLKQVLDLLRHKETIPCAE